MLINGIEYLTISDVAKSAGVTRQTLWRWRTAGLIPLGQKFRRRLVVYTAGEVASICDFANRLEKVEVEISKMCIRDRGALGFVRAAAAARFYRNSHSLR